MGLILETDLGRDPDDLFALIFLIENNVNIQAITITPGDPDQVAIARFVNTYYGLDIPIGVADMNREKLSSGGVHYKLLDKYRFRKTARADGYGFEIIAANYMNCDDILIIGPCTNIAKWIQKYSPKIYKATMQGGFLPSNNLEKFKGVKSTTAYNLCEDRAAATTFLNYPIEERRMIGKNVTHGMLLEKNIFKDGLSNILFDFSLEKRSHGEVMHDPLAAVCHLYSEIGTWIRGKTIRAGDLWTTDLNRPEDYILSDVNENKFWEILMC